MPRVLRRGAIEADRLELIARRGLFDDRPKSSNHNQNRDENAPVCILAQAHAIESMLLRKHESSPHRQPRPASHRRRRPSLMTGQLRDIVRQVIRNPVEHDHGKNFVDAEFRLQKPHDHAPQRTGDRCGDEAQRNQQIPTARAPECQPRTPPCCRRRTDLPRRY